MMLEVTTAIDGVYRVAADGETAGYIVEAGAVFVCLRGTVYNTPSSTNWRSIRETVWPDKP